MELVKWNKLRQAIVEAKSIDEVKLIKDKAEAMRAYSKQIGESLIVQNDICEIKLRAERRMGEMLKEMPKAKGTEYGGKQKIIDGNMMQPSMSTQTLLDIGIQKHQSSRYQKIADLPEETFEKIIVETKQKEKELTETLMISTSKKIDREIEINEMKDSIEDGTAELPEGKFEVIVVDPPWNYGRKYDPKGSRVANPYPEMSFEEIEKVDIPSSEDCVLWLWTTQQFIWDAKKLLKSWGFEYKAMIVWDKEKMGMGSWLRMQCEFCLLGIKGKPIWEGTDVRDIIREARTSHSAKPKTFYKMVEENCVGRKLDYFARKKREGWEVYGTIEETK